VPMFPHTLSSRPIVVDANSEVKITISADIDIYPQISCDGQVHITAAPGDTVTIRKMAHKARLIHPLDHDFYETCRTKLGWASQHGDA
jgi:NAD+ kinase